MKVSIKVPANYHVDNMWSYLKSISDISNFEMLSYYSYLLQLTSFDYNINWIVDENRVELELPYQSIRSDSGSKFAEDVPLLTLNARQDLLTAILVKITQDVSPERVKSHFQIVNNQD